MSNEKNIRPGMKIKMTSYDELCGVSDNNSVEIEIEKILDNPRNPYKVLDNEEMDELVSSVKQFGIMEPVSVIKDNGNFLLVSGHRRKHAAMLAGLEKMPVIVLEDMTEDEMDIRMVDANIQRRKLPSEIAHSYKLKYEAMKHQGNRSDSEGEWSQEKLGKEFGMSGRQVQRYLRLNELIDELLDAVDNKKIQLMLAVDISFLSVDIQEKIYDAMLLGIKPNQEMVLRLKRIQDAGMATKENISEVIKNKEHKENRDIIFSEKQLDSYFPMTYGKEERKKVILDLLKEWKNNLEGEE